MVERSSGAVCPSCGGAEAEALAPGLWRCVSRRLVGVVDGPGPFQQPVYMPCLHEYQTAPQVPSTIECHVCGTFAIGRCMQCRRAVCGYHSRLVADRRTCAPCVQDAKRQREAAAAEAASALREDVLAYSRALDCARDPGRVLEVWRSAPSDLSLEPQSCDRAWSVLLRSEIFVSNHDVVSIKASPRRMAPFLSWVETDRVAVWHAPAPAGGWDRGEQFDVYLDADGQALCSDGHEGRFARRVRPKR